MPPEERRAALVGIAMSMIRDRGEMPSTREIAEASGVAEGTLFRVFETKEDLIGAVLAASFCPAPLLQRVEEIDRALPLRARLVAVVTVLQQRYSEVFDLMRGLGLSAPPRPKGSEHHGCSAITGHREHEGGHSPRHGHADRALVTMAISELIEPDADALSCAPADLAHYLRLLTFSGSHPQISDGGLLSPATIVDVILGGVSRRAEQPTRPVSTPTQKVL